MWPLPHSLPPGPHLRENSLPQSPDDPFFLLITKPVTVLLIDSLCLYSFTLGGDVLLAIFATLAQILSMALSLE